MDIQTHIDDVLDSMSNLAELLETETADLRNMKLDAIGAIQPRKQELSNEFEKKLRDLLERSDELAAATREDAELKQHITTSWEQFSAILNENATALSRARDASERVVEIIVEAARKGKATQATGYSGMATTEQKSVSIAIDEKL